MSNSASTSSAPVTPAQRQAYFRACRAAYGPMFAAWARAHHANLRAQARVTAALRGNR
jgi:hypothetical protein